MFVIYKHSANNKSYIGYTKHTIEKRFQNHIAYANRGSDFVFHKAIRKYGKECWTSETLATCESVTEARELEKRFIAEFGSNVRGKGYNMTVGGEGNTNKGVPLKPEHKAKVVAALRTHSHAQYEIRVYALAMLELIRPICPVAVTAWEELHLSKK